MLPLLALLACHPPESVIAELKGVIALGKKMAEKRRGSRRIGGAVSLAGKQES